MSKESACIRRKSAFQRVRPLLLKRKVLHFAHFADWSSWNPTSSAGEAWSVNGFYAVLWQYVGVVAILAKLYVSIAIYYFFYGIISSLVKWIKSPYLPFKTK